MTSLEIRLKYHGGRPLATAAVLLSGDSPTAWLDELSRFPLPLESLRFLILPQSRSNLSPDGVLVCFPQSGSLSTRLPGQHYGVVGTKLFIPVASRLTPEMDEQDWQQLLNPEQAASVWHPRLGLIPFEAHDVLQVSDLLQLPLVPEGDWNAAQPGTAFPSRLLKLEAPLPESPEKMLSSGADGIGSKAQELSKFHGGVMESLSNMIRRGLHSLIRTLAQALLSKPPVSDKAGRPPAPPSKISQKLSEWAAKAMQVSEKVLSTRHRELQKLLRMLQETPDKGLEYAIPFSNQGEGKGFNLGDTLSRRSPSFNLDRLFGNGTASFWDVPPDVQFELLQHYRRLAEREIGLGRYQRAAYIYAELLGELPAAATTLMNGRFYREAAVLFRDKLYRPLDAANCLEQGGLLHEAIGIYESLRQHEAVGRLYERLEEPDNARAAYRRHVDVCLEKRDYLTAADFLERQLKDPAEALNVLSGNWMTSTHSRECLIKWFELLGRLNRHDMASQRLEELVTEKVPANRKLPLVEGLSAIAGVFPNVDVRRTAADATRRVIARELTQKHDAVGPMLRAMERLTPDDLLLPRDSARFLRWTPKKTTTPVRQPRRAAQRIYQAELKTLIPLNSNEVIWNQFVAEKQTLYASMATNQGHVALIGKAWNESPVELWTIWPPESGSSTSTFLMAVDEVEGRVHLGLGQRVLSQTKLSHPVTGQPMTVGTPPWLSEETRGMAHCSGITWTVEYPSLALKGFQRNGLPVANRQLIPPPDWELPDGREIPVHAREEAVYVGLGSTLIQVTQNDRYREIEWHHEIHQIIGSAPQTRSRLVVLSESSGVLIWPTMSEESINHLGDDLSAPLATFLRDGRLIVYSQGRWQLYSTQRNGCEFLGELTGINHVPCNLLPGPSAGQFAVCTQNDVVGLYEIGR